MLVDAESTTAAESATLVPQASQAAMRTIAQTLAVIGDDLWDTRAGSRSTGFLTSLLTQGTSAQSGPDSSH